MAVLTADHKIPNDDRFAAVLHAALDAAGSHDALVTIGVPPTRPDTGFGYIEIAGGEPGPAADGTPRVHAVHRFREKPDLATAREFLASGRFLWNSGMFFWRLGTFLRELGNAQPAMVAATHAIAEALRAGDEALAVRHFESLPSISIDYALLEHASRVLVVSGAFDWEDVGSWDALDRTHEADGAGNVVVGEAALVDTGNSIVWNDGGRGDRAVALVGVENLIVVVTGDSVLVAHKDRAQDVRKAVNLLRERGATQL